jgi:hypothetical protein
LTESRENASSSITGTHLSPYGAVPDLGREATLAVPEKLGFWSAVRAPLILFFVGLVGLGLFSWDHLPQRSTDPHFIYQADSFLNGQLELMRAPPHGNDWATWIEIRLANEEVLRGVWFDRGQNKFITLDGEMFILQTEDLIGSRQERHHFVSFPPGPAVLMMPGVWIWGYEFNDVLFTLLFAALNFPLLYILLRRLSRGGRSARSPSDNVWLVALFGFGTVYLWSSIMGQVWFTALIIGVTFTLLYLIFAIDARRPFLAGLFLACAFATRTPLLFTSVVFFAFVLFPGGRFRREDWGGALWTTAKFSLVPTAVGLSLLYMNHLRFEDWHEFGHRYLAAGGLERIRDYGLFNYHFLSRNLASMFTLLPRLQPTAPYILISKHGMSLFLTTPVLFYLFRSRRREYRQDLFWYRLMWITVAIVALVHLFYQNTGWEQFGYRFSLDYTPYLILLLAIGRRPFGKVFMFWVLIGFAVNAFGAITFKRMPQFYTDWFFDP